MVRKTELTNQINKARMILSSGKSAQQALEPILEWKIEAQGSTSSTQTRLLNPLADLITNHISNTMIEGGKGSLFLNEMYPLVRKIELNSKKLEQLKKSFGLQGALSVVLPWFFVFSFFKLNLNLWLIFAIVLQSFGIFIYYYLLKKTTQVEDSEELFLITFATAVWSRSSSNSSFKSILSEELNRFCILQNHIKKRAHYKVLNIWKKWIDTVNSGIDCKIENIFGDFTQSSSIAQMYNQFIQNGSHSANLLKDIAVFHLENWVEKIQERSNQAPQLMSIIFALILGPSSLLVMMGAMWPDLMKFI